MRLVADDDPVVDIDAVSGELVDLREERLRIDDDAVADHACDSIVQDARGQQPQDELASTGIDRMARVVSALVARDDRKIRREEVDNLSLALIAPLRAEHRYVHTHQSRSILVHPFLS